MFIQAALAKRADKEFDKLGGIPYHPLAMKRVICFTILCMWVWIPNYGHCVSPGQEEDQSYVWPIEWAQELSSTFGEHRSFRFHSGIDIPTHQRRGYKVLACESGYVFRLFTSWRGYGKAVYLKLDDGRFAVYGHLDDFSESISEVVTHRQFEARRYRTDFLMPVNQMRVNRGELIGYSGESGWGAPHLHFELRDSTGDPINPLTSGLDVKDRIAPTIEYLAIRPLDVAARANGSTEPVIFPLDFDEHERLYRLPEAPVVEGEIGLELSAYDQINNTRFNLGIYGIEVHLDDSLVFSSRYDRFSFENTHKVELDRDFELSKKGVKMLYKLFLEEQNDLRLYDPGGGRIDSKIAEPGPHKVKIKVFDAARNSSILLFVMIFDQRPSILACSFEEDGGEQRISVQYEDLDDEVEEILLQKSPLEKISWKRISLEKISGSPGKRLASVGEKLDEPALVRIRLKDSYGAWSDCKYFCLNSELLGKPGDSDSLRMKPEYKFKDDHFIFDLHFNQVLKEAPAFSLGSGGFVFDPLYWEQLDEESYRCVFPFTFTQAREMELLVEGVSLFGDEIELRQSFPVAIITKSWGGRVRSPDGRAEIEFEPKAVYQNLNVVVRPETTGLDSQHKLVGQVYSFEPSTVPLNGYARIYLRYPSEAGCDPHKLGLYELTREGDWSFVDRELDTLDGTVAGKVKHLSAFALLEDTLPPKISHVSIAPTKKFKGRKPRITGVLKDDLSGIGSDEDVRVEIDGEWMIPEYDPEKHILTAHPVLPLSPGKHLLSIWVRDRVGNETEITREFSVKRR